MSQQRRTGTGDIQALLSSSGAAVVPDDNGNCLLTVATYYFILGGAADSMIESLYALCDSAIAGTFTVETTNLPRYKGGAGSGTADVTDWSTTAGHWVKEDPTTAYVAVTSGAGFTVTNLTVVKTAGTAGAFSMHLGNLGTKRARIKAVITTQGNARLNGHGKD